MRLGLGSFLGGVSNVDIDGNNTLEIKAMGVTISTFETLPLTHRALPLYCGITTPAPVLQVLAQSDSYRVKDDIRREFHLKT